MSVIRGPWGTDRDTATETSRRRGYDWGPQACREALAAARREREERDAAQDAQDATDEGGWA